eukprot:scaffold39879_cov191-Amphora_coffeaeformis.AAC.2
MKEAEADSMTLRESIFNMAQEFVRTAFHPCEDKRPLLLWLDDYLGNEQREILKTTELSQGSQVLSNYYGFGFLSYADVVRDWVYGDTHEAAFSPGGWYKQQQGSFSMNREIHPGQDMHMSVAWIVAFNLLHMATTHCSLEAWDFVKFETKLQHRASSVPGLPDLKEGTDQLRELPRPRPNGLPPRLTNDLKLDDISKQWHESANVTVCPVDDRDAPRCPFLWLSGPSGPISQKISSTNDVHKYFEPVLVEPNNWALVDDTGRKDKYGFMPQNTTQNSVMTMEFNMTETPVQMIGFFFLKSYGDKWENSMVTVDVQAKHEFAWRSVTNHTMVGFHDKKTSEMYTEEVHLPNPVATLKLSFRLVNGTTFKLLGIAVCRPNGDSSQ